MTNEQLLERIIELKLAYGKLSLDLCALQQSLAKIARSSGIDDVELMNECEKNKQVLWQKFLESIEKKNPALAARIDQRSIDEIQLDA